MFKKIFSYQIYYDCPYGEEFYSNSAINLSATPWPGTPWGDGTLGHYPSTTQGFDHFHGQDSVKGKFRFDQQGLGNVVHDPTQIIQNMDGNNAINPHNLLTL